MTKNIIAFAPRKFYTDAEVEKLDSASHGNLSIYDLVLDLGSVSGFLNDVAYIAHLNEQGKLIFTCVKDGKVYESLDGFEAEAICAYNDMMLKTYDYFYVGNDYGYVYRIDKTHLIPEIRSLMKQMESEGSVYDEKYKTMPDEQFIDSTVFNDILNQNFEETLADYSDKFELIGSCDQDNILAKHLFQAQMGVLNRSSIENFYINMREI